MIILKCKMCGGDLEILEGKSTAECEYCGSVQTVPNVDDEKKLKLFARAHRLRINCEFDKAAGVYESIVADFPEESEAYWGLVLCRYGIEYVDDPAGKKIPTCHRSTFESVMKDRDFELACEYADAVARKVYRSEAKVIEEIRKGIVAVSANEAPYDIFICYKETDTKGERTLDSVLSQDIYEALTDRGYRVFFSRISLEDKLGTEYEPYIFAALNSARIMLAVGTDYDCYNAVWVKNEWSRYLKLMAQDKTKHLIPCYKGIDAYDMPEEFARLQAQDLGRMGAIQDICRGVEKLLGNTEHSSVEGTAGMSGGIASLLKRIDIFLGDGNWQKADEYCEKVLDIDPECARAYLGKVLAEYKIKKAVQLADLDAIPDSNINMQKVLHYGDEMLISEIEGYRKTVNERNRLRELEHIYGQAAARLKNIRDLGDIRSAKRELQSLGSYKDAPELVKSCDALYKEYEEKLRIQALKEAEDRAALIRLEAEREEKKKYLKIERTKELKELRLRTARVKGLISAGYNHTVGVKTEGSVCAAGQNASKGIGRCKVFHWNDIVAVSAGNYHTVGIKADGRVVATDFPYKDVNLGQCDLSEWENIVETAAGSSYTVGLKSDGSVVAAGNNTHGQCNVSGWKNIIGISVGSHIPISIMGHLGFVVYCHTVGLCSDGRVVATGCNNKGQCDVSDWSDIVSVSAGASFTLGLKADGSVLVAGELSDFTAKEKIQGWEDIISVSAGYDHAVGLKADGSVVAAGCNNFGECNIQKWHDIIYVDAGLHHTVGLTSDGKAVGTVPVIQTSLYYGQGEVSEWKLFESIDTVEQERAEQKEKSLIWQSEGKCRYCGGELKGIIVKKCANCSRVKDY